MTWTLHAGDWRDHLPTEKRPCVLITDAPYGARTHKGRRTGSAAGITTGIIYSALTKPMVSKTVRAFLKYTPEWWVFFSSHDTWPWWEAALRKAGQYVFPPVPWVKPDPAPRLAGDGPDCSCEWLCIARPKKRLGRYGHRPGHYFENTSSTRGKGGQGQKPITLMRRIVLDYSEPGQLVIDPFAGTGTTLLAAALEWRDSFGCEIDERTAKIARQRMVAFDKQPALPGVIVHMPKQMELEDGYGV